MTLELKNPHSVLAALQERPKAVTEIAISSTSPSAGWQEVAKECARLGKPVFTRVVAPPKGGRRDKSRQEGRSAANFAMIQEKSGVDLKTLFRTAETEGEHGIWLALDQVQDPQNVGAIFRSASFFGVRGIVMLKDNAASLTGTVYDTAAGGVEYVPHAVQANMKRTLEAAKEAGLWILGSSERGTEDFNNVALDRSWLIVLGNEEKGMRRLTEESCDVVCRLNPKGAVHSLNVSVAAAVLISGLSARTEVV
ncbi:Putative TrmH family tRNA/rRNA methyltransferase [Polystyrenella longa]|uniref:TrmH family tRNA/rRNA methyltransferase n=1 Tax=Polystyrenella longa TaxID=2528007 RepID=A0A518CP78_9PLAN|nr:RNA methyltransferase [Polystyrenella longa]QDU81029.1 Putative TrmH family tRNA/rRNA methyltransferase [Polystyrenella longa]